MWASIIAIAQQSKFDPPIGYIHISATNYHPANVYGGSENEWVTFGSGRMIMGADPQLPVTGGSEYITEAQLPAHDHEVPAHDHSYSDVRPIYHSDRNAITGNQFSAYYVGTLSSTTGSSGPFTTSGSGSGQAYYPRYIRTYMWMKTLYSGSIIYSAEGDAMGTFADVLGSLYPVGAQIYRTSAISAHPSDATKVQPFPTEAPLQQWQLVDNGSNTVVLEELLQSGETTSFCGRATLSPATAIQKLPGGASGGSRVFTVLTGSEITNFTPVLGTKKVKYSFQFHHAHDDADGLANYLIEFKIDSGSWTTILDTSVSAFASSYYNAITEMAWVITLDDIDDGSSGRTTAVRPVIGIRVLGCEYSYDHETQVHNSKYHGAAGPGDYFRPPLLEVKCIGQETQALTYERTA